MTEIKLTRTNKRPVVFMGEEVLSTNNRTVSGHNQNRWTKVAIYRTANTGASKASNFIVGIGHITCWQGEQDNYSVEYFDTEEGIVAHLEENVPSLAEEIAHKLNVVERL